MPETAEICGKLALDALGLLASGSLLIVVDGAACDDVIASLRESGVETACIGDLTTGDPGAIIDRRSQQPLPRFERDELARFLKDLDESAHPR